MTDQPQPNMKGRGAQNSPPNRFGQIHAESDFEHVADDDEYIAELHDPKTQYLPDTSRSIISENDSPDLHFRYSLNPYRGCLHGWIYSFIYPRLIKYRQDNGLRREKAKIEGVGR